MADVKPLRDSLFLHHKSLSIPYVAYFPKCNNVDTNWYVRMYTNLPPVDPKVEMSFALCEKEDTILEPTFPVIDNHLPH